MHKSTSFMDVYLHQFCIHLQSEAKAVQQYWQRLFAGWFEGNSPSAEVQLSLALVEALPSLPDLPPFFLDGNDVNRGGLLAAYRWEERGVLLHYLEGAVVRVPLAEARPCLTGHIIPQVLRHGRLDDITFTRFAPCLRRHGDFLVHAFGVCDADGRCVLIVGPSGSGKTTTGLSLILAGWELLANDILLIERRADGIYALSTPGGLSIREETLKLLPDCERLLTDVPCVQHRYELTNQEMLNGRRPEAKRISAVYFCQVEERERTEIRPLSQAVAMARLMEQSIDRWDEAMFETHMTILQELSQQAAAYTLHLGRDVARLPDLLAKSV
jgi:hypothetical protein